MVHQVHPLNRLIDQTLPHGPLDPLDPRKQVQVFNYCQLLEDCVVLRAVANLFAGETKPSLDIPAANRYSTSSGHCVIGQTLEDCSLTSAIDTKQCETLALVKSETQVIDSSQIPAEASLVDFLQFGDAHRHLLRSCSNDAQFLLFNVFILDLGTTFFLWKSLTISILYLLTTRPIATLEHKVEASGPAVPVYHRLKEYD